MIWRHIKEFLFIQILKKELEFVKLRREKGAFELKKSCDSIKEGREIWEMSGRYLYVTKEWSKGKGGKISKKLCQSGRRTSSNVLLHLGKEIEHMGGISECCVKK